MTKVTIWHNPRCSKSRAAMALIAVLGVESTIYKYLDTPASKEKLSKLLAQLDMSPRELMRTKEDIYKELNLCDETSDEKLIDAMVSNPKLIERPIVILGDRAVVGRPMENIEALLAKL